MAVDVYYATAYASGGHYAILQSVRLSVCLSVPGPYFKNGAFRGMFTIGHRKWPKRQRSRLRCYFRNIR